MLYGTLRDWHFRTMNPPALCPGRPRTQRARAEALAGSPLFLPIQLTPTLAITLARSTCDARVSPVNQRDTFEFRSHRRLDNSIDETNCVDVHHTALHNVQILAYEVHLLRMAV